MLTSSAAKIMRAIRVAQFGGPEVLQVCCDVPIPTPGPNEVLIKVRAAGVNPVDTYIRQGTYAIKPDLPYTPGKDVSGIVELVGENVTKYRPGDRVFTLFKCRSGGYAEYSATDTDFVFPLHESLSFSQGAALGVPYFTAYRALFKKANVQSSDAVLVHGASGAVGLAAVQLAKLHGCTVYGTAGTNEGMELITSHGVDKAFCHRQDKYHELIKEATNGNGVDVILEMLADANLETDLSLLKNFGRVAVIGSRGSVNITPRLMMAKETSVMGVMLGHSTSEEINEMWNGISKYIEDGSLKPVIDKEMKLDDASEAHDYILNSSGAKGKIVLIP